jgi:hypothetical protein
MTRKKRHKAVPRQRRWKVRRKEKVRTGCPDATGCDEAEDRGRSDQLDPLHCLLPGGRLRCLVWGVQSRCTSAPRWPQRLQTMRAPSGRIGVGSGVISVHLGLVVALDRVAIDEQISAAMAADMAQRHRLDHFSVAWSRLGIRLGFDEGQLLHRRHVEPTQFRVRPFAL